MCCFFQVCAGQQMCLGTMYRMWDKGGSRGCQNHPLARFHGGWVWLQISLCGRVLCMVLVHLRPVVTVIVCHAIATDGVGGVLDHGLCLGWIHGVFGRFDLAALGGCHTLNVCYVMLVMFRYQYCLVGGLEAIVFGSIRWCVWLFRPSSPLRLPPLKCLLLLLS